MFTSNNIFKQNKYENYKKEQVIAVAEWLINAIQQEIPRINTIRNARGFLEKKLRENILVYGNNVDLPFHKLTEEKKEKFKQVFIEAVWHICETDALQNRMDYIHLSCIPGEGCPEVQTALFRALDAALIDKKLLENIFIGCYMMKNGKVDAYVKIGYNEPSIRKDIYDPNVKHALQNN